jgi:hypothetical protein
MCRLPKCGAGVFLGGGFCRVWNRFKHALPNKFSRPRPLAATTPPPPLHAQSLGIKAHDRIYIALQHAFVTC